MRKLIVLSALLTCVFLSCQSNSDGYELPKIRELNSEAISLDMRKDNEERKVMFRIQKNQKVKIRANLEVLLLKDLEGEYLDGIKLYFDADNSKSNFFNPSDREFYIFPNQPYAKSFGIIFKYRMYPEQHKYCAEIKIPWSAIGYSYEDGRPLGFDCSIIDNDGSGSLSKNKEIVWHSKDADIFLNPSLYGTLLLNDGRSRQKDDYILAYNNLPVQIDGFQENVWKGIESRQIANVAIGALNGSNDNKASFKMMQDKKNIYLFYEIFDDVLVFKDKAYKMCDYGWIENFSGEVVWKVGPKEGKNAGGDVRNKMVDTTILLAPGQYSLHYFTDESHSPSEWLVSPPNDQKFYGIKIQNE